VDEEAADVFETPDSAGKNLLMSRRHVWQDHVLRRAEKSVAALHSLQSDLEARMAADKQPGEGDRKRKRVFEDYQMEQWALDSMDAFEAETSAEAAKIAAERRSIEAKKAALRTEIKYAEVCERRTVFCESDASACVTA
jgi:hypothetical protein